MKDLLARLVPELAAFSIAGTCKCLGFWNDPGATAQMNWGGPVLKLKTRVKEWANAAVPVSTATLKCQFCGVSVLGYIAQTLGGPPSANLLEVGTGSKLLRLPGRAFPASFFAQVDTFGLVKISSLVAYCMASLARTAANEGRPRPPLTPRKGHS